MSTNATMERPRSKSRRASKALKQARTHQTEAERHLQESLSADPVIQLSIARSYGWDLAREDAEESVKPFYTELESIDERRIAGKIDSRTQERLARDVDALIERIREARQERLEAYGFPIAARGSIRTSCELRMHVSQIISAAERVALVLGSSCEARDFTEDNRVAWKHAQRLSEENGVLSPPPVPTPIGEPHYLVRLRQWCIQSERLPAIEDLAKRVAFLDAVVKCDTGLRLYIAIRRELFKTIIDVGNLRGCGWNIRFTCDLENTPTEFCYALSNRAAAPASIDVRCEGLRIPFHHFRLETARGRRPRRGSPAHRFEQKLECLLGRLHLITIALRAVMDTVQDGASLYVSTVDTRPLKCVASKLQFFPFWPAFSSDRSIDETALAEDESTIASARKALKPLLELDIADALDPDDFLPLSVFKAEFEDVIRHAIAAKRKRKRVRSTKVDGQRRVHVGDVLLHWPDALRTTSRMNRP